MEKIRGPRRIEIPFHIWADVNPGACIKFLSTWDTHNFIHYYVGILRNSGQNSGCPWWSDTRQTYGTVPTLMFVRTCYMVNIYLAIQTKKASSSILPFRTIATAGEILPPDVMRPWANGHQKARRKHQNNNQPNRYPMESCPDPLQLVPAFLVDCWIPQNRKGVIGRSRPRAVRKLFAVFNS